MRKFLLIAVVLTAIAFGVSAASQGVTVSGKVGDYTYVDLGLPSGTKWATYNVGASKPSDYGDYFAWGETRPKSEYSWDTYKWTNDGWNFTKYTIEGRMTLTPSDDAATANWGEGWHMPTKTEQYELQNGCNWEWTNNFNGSGVAGRIGTSKANGNTIFLPAAGDRKGADLLNAGYYGLYWSSSLREDNSSGAYNLDFNSDNLDSNIYSSRNVGMSVRAVVKEKNKDTYKPIATNGVFFSGKVGGYTYVDLGLPRGTKWATYNVGASKPTDYGDYFAWGETTAKEDYSWETYKWFNGTEITLTKYSVDSKHGTVDNLTTLLTADDAATQNWGEGWRMPTKEEVQELKVDCQWEWTDDFNGSGVAGRIGISKFNGNIIFLPAAGYREGTDLYGAGYDGSYWSSSLSEDYSSSAYCLNFYSDYIDWFSYSRNSGQSVRAVVREK